MIRLRPAEICVLIFLTILYLFLRLYHLDQHVNYSDEQGKFLLTTYQIWHDRRPTLIGPPTSFSYDGRYFFQGPAMYYMLIPAMLLGNWEPLFGSYLIIFLNLIAVFAIYFATRKLSNSFGGFVAGLLFVIFPETVYYTTFVWNPNFLPFITSLVLVLLVGIGPFSTGVRLLLTGFLLGFALQFHYQIALLIILVFLYLGFLKKLKAPLLALLAGILIGYAPIIIFEFRHQFYNTKTILLLLENNAFSEGEATSYYFLSFISFFFAFLGVVAAKVLGKYRLLTVLAISIFVAFCLSKDIRQAVQGRGMPPGWKYQYVKKAAGIVLTESKKDFNLVNLLSGDTRAYALRFLVTASGKNPMRVEEYPKARTLFVISGSNLKETQSNPVWEIQSFSPSKLSRQWDLGGNFYLYELDKK